ncbi:hypothetical protein [Mycolicibacterium mucogenicum]|uniref:hypothetical protein n=1 Tax=Mycolicibacterium mucogenicum TaxID=56689 RepID=UPI0013F4F3A1|nr:hypothetical protein [Mycolicibacterium mucogenicum]
MAALALLGVPGADGGDTKGGTKSETKPGKTGTKPAKAPRGAGHTKESKSSHAK